MPSQPAPSVGIRWSAVRSDFNRRGIMIPCRDRLGRIQRIHIRLDQAIRRGYKALSGPYGVGSVYYPGLLEEIVCGDSPDELARSAAPLFKRMDVPSLDVWMPLFWDISVQAGFATPLDTWGIPHDVWRLRLPEPGIFLPLLEQHLPELSSLAEMTHAAQAA